MKGVENPRFPRCPCGIGLRSIAPNRAVLDVPNARELDGAREEWSFRTTVSSTRGWAASGNLGVLTGNNEEFHW